MNASRTWFPSPCRRTRPEYLDEPQKFTADLTDNLRDMRRLNRWFCGISPVIAILERTRPIDAALRLLDVGTGSGDLLLAVSAWAKSRGIRADLTGLDSSQEILNEAIKHVSGVPVQLVLGDAVHLPFPQKSFDIVTCNLVLHHLNPDEASLAVSEMWRVTRSRMLITDLRRSYLAYAAAWLASRSIARNKLTRHDAPLSVLRAYTPNELHSIAVQSGVEPVDIRRHPFFRQALLVQKGE